MSIQLTLRAKSTLPIEVATLLPQTVMGKTDADVSRMPILFGDTTVACGELFDVVQVAGPADRVVFQGDLSHTKRIGAGMSLGEIIVEGSAGMHTGAEASGGNIVVHGDCGDWCGAHLRGGHLRVRGNVGDCAGGAYRGASRGMTSGELLVHGNAGHELGSYLRRGLVVVCGGAGRSVGHGMLAGTVVVGGQIGAWPVAGLKRGSVIAPACTQLELLPTFRRCGPLAPPTYLKLLQRYLEQRGLLELAARWPATWLRASGDLLTGGRGEIWQPAV